MFFVWIGYCYFMIDFFVYIDGVCFGNSGSGGWGVLLCVMKGDEVFKECEFLGGVVEIINN